MDRLFLDANVLFSAALRPEGRVARLWRLDGVALLTSGYALQEVQRNLKELYREDLKRIMKLVRTVPDPTNTPLPANIDLPPKDRPILAAAIGSNASHLLTGDLKHFRGHFGRTVSGVQIESPGDYIRRREHSGE